MPPGSVLTYDRKIPHRVDRVYQDCLQQPLNSFETTSFNRFKRKPIYRNIDIEKKFQNSEELFEIIELLDKFFIMSFKLVVKNYFKKESRVQSPESRVQGPESRVQSPESRVQSPVQLLAYAKTALRSLTCH